MEITTTSKNNIAMIHLSGLFEYYDEAKLLSAAKQAMETQPGILAIDLEGVDHLNSACMAALLNILKMADEAKINFIIYGMNSRLHMLLEKVFSRDYVPLLTKEEFAERYF